MRSPNDENSSIDSRVSYPLRESVHRPIGNTRPLGKLRRVLTDRAKVFGDAHGLDCPQERGGVNPIFGGSVIKANFGTVSAMAEEAPETVSEAIFRAFFDVADREGLATLRKRLGIPSTTAERWAKVYRDGGRPSLNRENLETLCTLPEIRAAAAAALRLQPRTDATAWESIAGELSDLMDPSTGWELVRKLRAMKDVGLLDGGLSALDGMVTARQRATAEQAVGRSSQTRRKKAGDSG